jgi:thiamine biosynthesis lipoprotein ApbE
VRSQASITVTAPDAMTADVLATVLGPLEPAAAIAEAELHPSAACLVIAPDGRRWSSSRWGSPDDLSEA